MDILRSEKGTKYSTYDSLYSVIYDSVQYTSAGCNSEELNNISLDPGKHITVEKKFFPLKTKGTMIPLNNDDSFPAILNNFSNHVETNYPSLTITDISRMEVHNKLGETKIHFSGNHCLETCNHGDTLKLTQFYVNQIVNMCGTDKCVVKEMFNNEYPSK